MGAREAEEDEEVEEEDSVVVEEEEAEEVEEVDDDLEAEEGEAEEDASANHPISPQYRALSEETERVESTARRSGENAGVCWTNRTLPWVDQTSRSHYFPRTRTLTPLNKDSEERERWGEDLLYIIINRKNMTSNAHDSSDCIRF